ncbi:hypothetical protein U9M48_036974 [Paspalum notatum var. saurae]|uniref:Bet v I/Major latex protein domain-containing protein n=1 Tax=Paspalum notatum var. saurae TaxID=547442 RepID=A0AAQ3UE34_PASNO
MVACSFTDECAVAVPAERLWKAMSIKSSLLPKACAGYIDSVEVEGDGGVGSVTTVKFINPAVGGEAMTVKTRVVALDDAARVIRSEVLEGGKLGEGIKSQVNELKVEAAGEGASVVKIKVEYERLDGAALSPEHQAKMAQSMLGAVKKVEAYLAANPDEVV